MSVKQRILVVDDEQAIRRLLRTSLEAAGYAVQEANNGEDGLREAASRQPDLIILDLGLPDLGGLDALKRIREWSSVPILILTVQDSEDEKVAALDAGADDYLTKPFSVPELLARLRVLERHRQGSHADPILALGELVLDLNEHHVTLRGQALKLTTTEYNFLKVLARHAGKIVTQRQILSEVWGPHALDQSHYLRIYAAQLRKKIEDDPANPQWIITEPGVGYRLKPKN